MAQEGYLWLEEDVLAIRALLAREKARVVNTQNRPQPPAPPPTAPSTYVVRAPEGGIPALAFEGTGSFPVFEPTGVLCDIYQLLPKDDALQTPQLWPIYFDQLVYNLGLTDVPAGAWVLAHRERFGDWFCEGAIEEPGTGSFGFLEYRTSCIDGVNVRFSRRISVLSPLRDSVQGGWTFESYQGQCFFEGDTGTGSGTGTGHFSFLEYRTACEGGINVRYRRTVTVTDPLLGSNTTGWTFDSNQGSCDFPATGTSTGSFPFWEYKTDCIDLVNVRYKRQVSVRDHVRRSSLGDWVFDSYQGMCGFNEAGTGTATGSGNFPFYEYRTTCEAGTNVRYKRLVSVHDPIGHSSLGAWEFDSYQGQCATVLPECGDVFFYEEQVRCELGSLNVYRRVNTLTIVEGCLALTTSAWQYVRAEGCCDCFGTGSDQPSGTGTGGGTLIQTPCFALPMPETIHATIHGGSGTCGCVDSIPSFPMSFLPTMIAPYNWDGSFTDACSGGASTLHLACTDGTWQCHCDGGFGSLAWPNVTASSASWNGVTLSIIFSVSILSPCAGSFTVTITL